MGDLSAMSQKATRSPQVRPSKAPKVPKKGGAGGKFTWGVPGDELKDDGFMSDMKDPNYDPDDKEPFRLDSLQPRLEGTQLKSVIDKTLTSYLKGSLDAKEAAETMDGVTQRLYMHYIVSKLIRTGLPDKIDQVSSMLLLLSSPSIDMLNQEALLEGIRDVFDVAEDLELDAPGVGTALKNVVKILEEKDRLSSSFLPSQIDYFSRLKSLKGGLKDTLTELFVSHDPNELVDVTERTVCPAFHPLVVKHLIRSAVEQSDPGREVASRALSLLCGETGPITQMQCMRGMAKLLSETEDMTLDTPSAESALANFVARAVIDECVPPSFLENVNIFSLSDGDAGVAVIKKVRDMLSQDGAAESVAKVWTPAAESSEAVGKTEE